MNGGRERDTVLQSDRKRVKESVTVIQREREKERLTKEKSEIH